VKKILFVIPTLRDGGAERSLVNLLTELPPEKYDIDLLLFKMQGTFLSQVPQNVHIIKQPPILKKLYGPVKEAGIYMPVKVLGNAISKILKNGMGEQKAFLWEYFYKKVIDGIDKEYDVAVGYLGGESTYYIVDKVKAKRKIHWVHNDYRTSGMPKKYDLKLFPRVDAIVTISDECLEILKEEFPIFKDKMICIENITSSVVINNRATEFKPKEYIGVENVLLSVGRLSEQKGFDMAISAASKLKKQQINFKWFIIGSGPLESKLKDQIKKEKVEDYVVLIGTKENPYPYIKNCDLFVQPSRYEGKSVVIDEAKILAKPIVATAYPTVRDQIRNANEGVIVELSVDGIYKGLKEMVFDKTKQKEISNYLENHEYGNQTEIKKYIKLIEGE
jgi:glycosyltransferase involved in cell wall biosynthesis